MNEGSTVTVCLVLGMIFAIFMERITDSDWKPDEVCDVHCENARDNEVIAAKWEDNTCQCWYEPVLP